MGEVIRVSGRAPDVGEFLKEAMLSQRFADVALCCPDGQRFLAHRLVLSAASPYLQVSIFLFALLIFLYLLLDNQFCRWTNRVSGQHIRIMTVLHFMVTYSSRTLIVRFNWETNSRGA